MVFKHGNGRLISTLIAWHLKHDRQKSPEHSGWLPGCPAGGLEVSEGMLRCCGEGHSVILCLQQPGLLLPACSASTVTQDFQEQLYQQLANMHEMLLRDRIPFKDCGDCSAFTTYMQIS